MAQQFTIWCRTHVRERFNDYCNYVATPDEFRRLTLAFEAFHALLSGGTGANPPIQYVTEMPAAENAVEIEVRTGGWRFCIRADFKKRQILLECIASISISEDDS